MTATTDGRISTPERPWVPAKEAVATARAPNPDEEATIDLVHELFREWGADRLPLHEVRRLSTAYERFIATRFTPPAAAMFRPLMRLLDALIASDPTDSHGYQYQTKHGTFSEAELRAAKVEMTRTDDGRIRLLFPIRYPWAVKPDPKRGDPGIPDAPIYARTAEERWDWANRPADVPTTPRRIFE